MSIGMLFRGVAVGLSDVPTGLYLRPWQEIYTMLRAELKI